METEEFLSTLKRFFARKGRPVKIYSDNGRTFVGAARWLPNAMQDERLHDYLARMNIKWQFNLSRAPWWGGQFERMVGLVKQSFNKTVGNGTLTWKATFTVLYCTLETPFSIICLNVTHHYLEIVETLFLL